MNAAFRIYLLPATLFSLLMLGCRSSSVSSCGCVAEPEPGETLAALSASERRIIENDNGFGFRLFHALAEEKAGNQGNIFVSPLSVSMALAMAYNGARGATADEMAEVLGFGGMDRAAVSALYAKLVPALVAADPKVKIQIANSIWSRTGFEAEPDFLALNRSAFDAETRSLDFGLPDAAAIVNKWVSDKTHGLIPEIVKPPLPGDLVMMLINALYFKGDWSAGFDSKRTHDAVFRLADGSEKPCRMMYADGGFRYLENADAIGLELPYGDSLFSMVFLQPAAGKVMGNLIANLSEGAWKEWEGAFVRREGSIHVPKFKLEYQASLADTLAAMGMVSATSPSADFTGINKAGQLYISEVIHKTFVSVDETGTEAAAVTEVGIGRLSLPPALIRLDRPFVVLIREKTSGTLLFVGRIEDPTL